jgi:hypothetical protein
VEKLEFAENDAREMGKVLLDPDICGFNDVIELINKNKEEVSQSIEKVFKNAKKDDEILIYYSGHGKPSYKFDLCLLFKDTDPESLLATSLKFDYINECKEQSACNRVVVILDCCYSGTAGMRGDYLQEILSTYSGSGTILLTSTGQTGSNIAKEDKELKHGVFTNYLLKGLRDWGADYDDDGIITVDDIYKYTFNETKAKGLQHPQLKGSYEGEMILGRNPQKIRDREFEHKKEKLMQYLGTAPPSVLYTSLTILQKMYRNPYSLDPVELNIKPHLESLLEGKIQTDTYIEIVKYQDKAQKQTGEKKAEEQKEPQTGKQIDKEEQEKLQKQPEEEQKQKEKLEREKKERKEQEKLQTLRAEEFQTQREEEKKRIEKKILEKQQVEEQEKRHTEEETRKEREEQKRKSQEETKSTKFETLTTAASSPKKPEKTQKEPEGSSGKNSPAIGIFLVLLLIGIIGAGVYFYFSNGYKTPPGDGDPQATPTVTVTETQSETPTETITEPEMTPTTTVTVAETPTGSKPVTPPIQPFLVLYPGTLEFELEQGESGSGYFLIENKGDEALSWDVSTEKDWIIINRTREGITGGKSSDEVNVTVEADSMDLGRYDGDIAVNSNRGNQTIHVTLNVTVAATPIEVVTGFVPIRKF